MNHVTGLMRKRPLRAALSGGNKVAPRRSGVVLIIVLVVVVTLSLSAYTFSRLMLTHRHAAKLTGQQLQTRLLADSGVEMVKYFLSQEELDRQDMGGHLNNPPMFQGVTVLQDNDPASVGKFSVVSPIRDGAAVTATATAGGGVQYGLEDESARLNLNLVLLAGESARDLMMAIPGMTEEVADSILDWIDEDDEPRDYGAEYDYYSALSPPYEPRNGQLLTVEELLLVRGVTPELLFGTDQNRNTLPDAHESGMLGGSSQGTAPMAMGMGATDQRGWSAYLTIYSAERNTTVDGLPRINLNNSDLTDLRDQLLEVFNPEWVNFIIAYRLYGPYDGNEQGQAAEQLPEVDLEGEPSPSAEIGQVLDLIGAKVNLAAQQGGGGDGGGGSGGGSGGGGGGGNDGGSRGESQGGGGTGNQQEEPQVYASPFQDDPAQMLSYLSLLMDNCTVTEAAVIPGRLNVNLAPPELLVGVPGMTDEILDQLINQRDVVSSDLTDRSHETWLLGEAVVTLSEMKQMQPFICAGGDVFRSQIVGYYQGGGPSSRLEVVFDATEADPRIVLWRDISHLGRGYPLELLGVDLLSTP